jgi:hypothetical protein
MGDAVTYAGFPARFPGSGCVQSLEAPPWADGQPVRIDRQALVNRDHPFAQSRRMPTALHANRAADSQGNGRKFKSRQSAWRDPRLGTDFEPF